MAGTVSQKGSFISASKNRLKEIPFSDGQLIFVRDEQIIYRDEATGLRNRYTDLIVLKTENESVTLSTPYEKFYFVEETCVLWLYTNAWYQLTSSVANPIYIAESKAELPSIGQSNMMYICKKESENYIWDITLRQYFRVSSDWHNIRLISCGNSGTLRDV